MKAKLFNSLWGISLLTLLLFPLSLTAQLIPSTTSSSVTSLYSFTIHDNYVYLGGEEIVKIVDISDLSSVRTIFVFRFDRHSLCTAIPRPYCLSNIIDHIFPLADNLLACGSNGGVGGCSLFAGSANTSFTPINNFTVPLSGNVRRKTSKLSSQLSYIQNSIFVNTENDIIYTQYYDIAASSFTLGLRNFDEFTSTSSPTASSGIPNIISTFDSIRSSQTRNFFFNSPTVGRIFRHASTSTIDFDYIHIPYTEIVQESSVTGLDYEYLTPSFHGRLARICANDRGQFATNPNSPFNSFIGTFNKITIDCRQALGVRYSIDSSYVSIALKDIFILDSENIYGFFTSQNTAEELIQSSAVCKFISDRASTGQDFNIEKGFTSVYYDGYDSMAVSENTGWTCADPSARVTGDLFEATIINVLHMTVVFNEASLAFNKHFEGIVMDVTAVTTSSGSRNITLFYATTFDGYLIKMKVDGSISLVGEFRVTSNTKLINPEIHQINNNKYLFAISNNKLVKISLQLCHSYSTAITCYYDPECVWDNSTISCVQYDLTSVRDVPLDSDLIVDDTCQLSLLNYTLQSLNLSVQCQVKLPDLLPNIIVSTISGVSVATANSNYARHSNTYAIILITGLESLTGYRTTVKLNYVFGIVPDLVLVAYTQFEEVVGSSPSLTPICPSASTYSYINVTSPIDSFVALTVCANCISTQFCIATDMYTATVPYTFPWANCMLTTTLHNAVGLVANSSTCPSVNFNRCITANPGSFQHLNFAFITNSTSVTVVLEDGISPMEFGILEYTFTYDGMDYNLNSRKFEINALKPDTLLTILYTASTQCGLAFNASQSVTTDSDWSRVDSCQFSVDSSGLVFLVTFENIELCQGNLRDCIEVVSTCPLSFSSETSNSVTYAGVVEEGKLCTADVFPSGERRLLAYYGCTARLFIPITYSISNLVIDDITTNSVRVSYSILPSGRHYESIVSLLDSSDVVIQKYTQYRLTGSNLITGFGNLEENTVYNIRIEIAGDQETVNFNTEQSSLFNMSCSPISNYSVEQVVNTDTYQVMVIRNIQCTLGINADVVCAGIFDETSQNINASSFTILNTLLSPTKFTDNFAFGLFKNISVCPNYTDTNYRYIYTDSIIQSYVALPPISTTATATSTTAQPSSIPLIVITASVALFYLAVGTSSFTVLTSAGGLFLLFVLIVCYPNLLKKQELKTANKQEKEDYEMSGMNNPISDSS